MSDITVDLDRLEVEVQLNLNNATTSLKSMEPQHARSGLVSAATVLVIANIVVGSASNNSQSKRFQEYAVLAARLLKSYWKSFELQLKADDDSKPTNGAAHIEKKKDKRGKALLPAQKDRLIELLRTEVPRGQMHQWVMDIAEEIGVDKSTVYAYKRKLAEQAQQSNGPRDDLTRA